jgi:hypothetical protein
MDIPDLRGDSLKVMFKPAGKGLLRQGEMRGIFADGQRFVGRRRKYLCVVITYRVAFIVVYEAIIV